MCSGPPIDAPKACRRNDGTKHHDRFLGQLSLGVIDARQYEYAAVVAIRDHGQAMRRDETPITLQRNHGINRFELEENFRVKGGGGGVYCNAACHMMFPPIAS